MPKRLVLVPAVLLPLIVAVAGGVGCGGKSQLMPTPNVYRDAGPGPFADVPPALQNNRVEVLYVTDRAQEKDSTPEKTVYGHKRSRSIAFGVCDVRFGKDVSWDELVKASTSAKRSVKLETEVTKITELGRFPPTPPSLMAMRVESEAAAAAALSGPTERDKPVLEECHRVLSERLAKTPVKDVYMFVHGVKTELPGAALTIAEIWHFLGRQGVPVAYSWPAGGAGILRGYTYDYNSSEFTVYHLKQTLRAIALHPEVRKVHLIAHSRGTDALTSAVRELHIEITGAGRSTREELKLGTTVLAAPDLDVDVLIQRLATVRLGQVPERSVVYICAKDEALGFSQFLFGGMRLGKLKPEIFTPEELDAMRRVRNTAIIDARVAKPGSYGHNYFYSNPAVSSDLILLMRYGRPPGAADGRPLGTSETGFWTIDDKYPAGVKLTELASPETKSP